MKNLLLLLLLLVTSFSTAQNFGEVEIEGSIKVPAEADPHGITIYNKTSGRGSVSSEKGNFTIYAKLNDSLYFSALQYEDLLFVIDEQTVKSRTLNVEIRENINDLPEVVVRPHDLTGNLDVDAENIKTAKLDLPVMTAASINDYDYEWRPDGQSAVTNSAMAGNSGMKNGANPLAIIGGLFGIIFPPKKSKKPQLTSQNLYGGINLERKIRTRYDNAFFEEVLEIEVGQISHFINFMNSAGFPASFLEPENEIDLIQFMVEKSADFKKFNIPE